MGLIILSDILIYHCRFDKSGNEQLAFNLADWVFKEKGVLRVGTIKHAKKGENSPPNAYTVFDEVVSRSYLVI